MRTAALLWAIAVVLSAVAISLPTANAQVERDPSSPADERFLVFTNGDPDVSAAVRSAVERHGGRVADEARVTPELVLFVVSVPQAAAAEIAAIAGVREAVPEIVPSPLGGADPGDRGDADTSPSTCGDADGATHGP